MALTFLGLEIFYFYKQIYLITNSFIFFFWIDHSPETGADFLLKKYLVCKNAILFGQRE
jgi:hypothetical protein